MPPPIEPEDLIHRDIVIHSDRDWRRDRRQRNRHAVFLIIGVTIVAALVGLAIFLFLPARRATDSPRPTPSPRSLFD